jgi:hypothetical protein
LISKGHGVWPEVDEGDEETTVSVYAIGESRFAAEHASAGLEVTQAIWSDMEGFEGNMDHGLIHDEDDPG